MNPFHSNEIQLIIVYKYKNLIIKNIFERVLRYIKCLIEILKFY